MKIEKRGWLSRSLIAVMLLALLGGCSGEDPQPTTQDKPSVSSSVDASSVSSQVDTSSATSVVDTEPAEKPEEVPDSDPVAAEEEAPQAPCVVENASPRTENLSIGGFAYADHAIDGPETLTDADFTVQSSNPDVLNVSCKVAYNPLRLYVELKGVSSGSASYTIRDSTGNVKGISDSITVFDPTPPKPVQTYEETSAATQSQQVYITPYGKRWHLRSTCGGKNSYKVSIDEVGGRTPCKKCAGG